MLRWLIGKKLDAVERELGVSVDYLRHILRVSPRAFFKFLKIVPLEFFRRALPAGPYYVARIVAAQHEDCGPCVQIVVNLAKKAGISPQILRAALAGDLAALPEDLAETYRFAQAVVTQADELDELRERIRRRYGEAGLVELAIGIAACCVFPVTKRALGYATSCSRVAVKV